MATMSPPGPAAPAFAQLYPAVAPALHAWASMRLGSGDRGRIAPEDLVETLAFFAAMAADDLEGLPPPVQPPPAPPPGDHEP